MNRWVLPALLASLLWPRGALAQTEPPPEPAPPAPPPEAEPAEHAPDYMPDFSGYVQVFYRFNLDTNGDGEHRWSAFRVQRARFGIKGGLAPRVSYDIEVDPRAPEIGGVLRDAFLAVNLLPKHTFRLGQQKTQFGYENPESSTKLWAINRTEVSDNLSRGRTLRDIGIGLLGRIKLGGGLRIEDAITLVNGAGMNMQEDDDSQKNLWGRLGLRYKFSGQKLWFGVSGGFGTLFDEGDDGVRGGGDDFFQAFRRVGADVELDDRWVFVAAEYVLGHDRIDGGVDDGDAFSSHGYYVLGLFKTPWNCGPLVRFDVLDEDTELGRPFSAAVYRRFTVGAFWGLPDAPIRVLLNSEIRTEDGAGQDVRTYFWVQGKF